MRRLAASTLAALTVGTLLTATAPAATADTPGCVTRAEAGAVKKGFSKARVASIVDTAGRRMSFATSGGYTVEIRNYRTCSPYSSFVVSYQNGRMSNKAAVWVS